MRGCFHGGAATWRTCLVVWSIAIISACDGLITFEITREIPEQRVEGNALGGVLSDLLAVDIPLMVDIEEEQRARDTGPVQRVRVRALHLAITDTAKSSAFDEDDFDFLQSVRIYVRSARDDSELARVLVAELDPVPRDRERIDLVVTGADIKAHVEEGAVIESEARASLPADDETFDGLVTLEVEAL